MPALNINDLNNGKLDLDHMADVATSVNTTATDRLGHTKLTVKGAIDTLKAFNVRGAFASGTVYALKDVYTSAGIAYVTVTAHTSTSVAADLAAGKVTVHQGATKEELAADSGSSTIGTIQAGIGAVPSTVEGELRRTVWPEQFDAVGNGIADDRAAIQRAIDALTLLGGGTLKAPPGAVYKMAAGITWDSCKVGFNLGGATLSFATMTTGTALTPTQDNADVNQRAHHAAAHPFENAILIGPGFGVTAVEALAIEDLTGEPILVNAGLVMRGVAFQKFAVDIRFGAGSFFNTFQNCIFSGVDGAGIDTTYSIQINAAANSGERNAFISCLFGNRKYCIIQGNGNADTSFYNCSFDYFGQRAGTLTGGIINLVGGHTESGNDANYWWHVSGANPSLTVSGGHALVIAANKAAFEPFYCDSTCTNGGIEIRDMKVVSGGKTMKPFLIAGTGRAPSVPGSIQYSYGDFKLLTSDYSNLLTYGGFENANYVADWVLSVTGPGAAPARSAAQARTGTYSLEFVGSNSVTPAAVATFPIRAGQFPAIELWYRTTAVTGTSGHFYAQAFYADKAGNILYGDTIMDITTDIGTWTRGSINIQCAPKGAVNLILAVSMFGVGSGAPKGYIDDVTVTIS